MTNHPTRSPRKNLKVPALILASGIGLGVFGLVAILDASVIEGFKDFGDKYHFVRQQAVWLLIGSIVAIITASFPLGLIKKYSPIFYGITLVLMVLVLIPGIGSKFLGARRWIVAGPIVIQPSELLKITFIIYLSSWLDKARELKNFIVLLGVNILLIMLQPDLGTAIILSGSSFAIYYISGAKIKDILSFFSVLLVSIVVLIALSPYRMDRIKTFMNPESDPLGASYHINQIIYGLGSGGFSGVGIGKSRQKYAYLPESTTDSIFVIIAEEFGFLGGSILIVLLTSMVIMSLRYSLDIREKFDKLLASGISLMFLIQIFVNLCSMTAIVPLTGVPLPFISYGGSSLVTNFIALGVLINVTKKT